MMGLGRYTYMKRCILVQVLDWIYVQDGHTAKKRESNMTGIVEPSTEVVSQN